MLNGTKKTLRCLTIITTPYNSTLIFGDIILDVIKEGKKVLYIWGRDRENKELVEDLKKIKKTLTYGHLERGEGNSDINFTHYNDVSKCKREI